MSLPRDFLCLRYLVVILAIRTYALHQRSRKIAFLLIVLGFLIAGGGIVRPPLILYLNRLLSEP